MDILIKDKISIIVPVYNLEAYIERSVNSILHQTFQNLEVILVDDGSNDRSPWILDRLAESDSRIKVIHKENEGVSKTRIAGIRAATGDWIGFVDGDDLIEADMYERLLRNAVLENADISHCGYQMVFPNRTDYYYNSGKRVVQDWESGLNDLLEGAYVEPGLWNKLYRPELLRKALTETGLDRSIRINEDLLLNYYLFKHAKKSVYEDFCPYHYMIRQGSASVSSLNAHKLEDPLKVLHILEKETSQNLHFNRIVKRRILAQLVSLATLPNGEQKRLIHPYRKQARKELRQRLLRALNDNYPLKLKIQVLWVAVFPQSYTFVHQIYAKASGIDKKYSVD